MTVHRDKTCACGHGASFHDKDGKKHGRCLYGEDRTRFGTTVAPCSCMRFHGRGAKSVVYDEESTTITKPAALLEAQEPEVLAAIDDIIRGFQRLRAALPMQATPIPPMLDIVSTARGVAWRNRDRPKTLTTKPSSSDEPKLPAGAQRMLDILASHGRLTRIQLGTLSGAPARKSTFRTYFGLLKQHELVVLIDDEVELTAAGRKRAKANGPVQTREDILATWAPKLAAGARLILETVVKHGPLTRDAVGERTGIDPLKSTWRTYFGKLKSNQLVVENGRVIAAGAAFASTR